MRVMLGLFLSLMLVATSVSSAVMHSEMQGATEITICADLAGAGVTTLQLDATGKPLTAHHNCPECLAALSSVLLPAQITVLAPQTSQRSHYPATMVAGTGRPAPAAIARGPPRFL